MRFKYSLPFKTQLMLWMISPFRQQSDGPPTMRQIKIARKTVPRFFLSTWVLGRMAPLQSVEDKMIPVRDAVIKVRIYRPLGEAACPAIGGQLPWRWMGGGQPPNQ